MQRHFGGNLAVRLSIFGVRTWNFDSWFGTISWRQPNKLFFDLTFFCQHTTTKKIPANLKSQESQQKKKKKKKCSLVVSGRSFRITSQKFRSQLVKLSGAFRYWRCTEFLPGPACRASRATRDNGMRLDSSSSSAMALVRTNEGPWPGRSILASLVQAVANVAVRKNRTSSIVPFYR